MATVTPAETHTMLRAKFEALRTHGGGTCMMTRAAADQKAVHPAAQCIRARRFLAVPVVRDRRSPTRGTGQSIPDWRDHATLCVWRCS